MEKKIVLIKLKKYMFISSDPRKRYPGFSYCELSLKYLLPPNFHGQSKVKVDRVSCHIE